jgi:hypothetical protein
MLKRITKLKPVSRRMNSQITNVETLKTEKLSETSKKVEVKFQPENPTNPTQEKPILISGNTKKKTSIFDSIAVRRGMMFIGGILFGTIVYLTSKYYLDSEISNLNKKLSEIQKIKTKDQLLVEQRDKEIKKIIQIQEQRNQAKELPVEDLSFEKLAIKKATKQWNSMLQKISNQIDIVNQKRLERDEKNLEKRIFDELKSKGNINFQINHQ